MKKKKWTVIIATFVIGIMLWGYSGKSENGTMDEIRNSAMAKLETSSNEMVYVDSEIATLISFADLEIQAAPMEPADNEEDWIYRITFNPSEKVSGSNEIVVAFHENYIQIGSEFYLPKSGVEYSCIFEWVESKVDYFFADSEG